jgi:protein-disulfide isomerase
VLAAALVAVASAALAQTPGGEAPHPILPAADAPTVRGSADAPATLVAYLDFASEACGRVEFMMKAIADAYPDGVRLVFKQDPHADDPVGQLPHQAALAAGQQGRFWDMADILFANPAKRTRDDLLAMAAQIGLDETAFATTLDSGRFAAAIDADRQEAAALKIAGTPAWFLNGARLPWPLTFTELRARVDTILAAK